MTVNYLQKQSVVPMCCFLPFGIMLSIKTTKLLAFPITKQTVGKQNRTAREVKKILSVSSGLTAASINCACKICPILVLKCVHNSCSRKPVLES